MTRISPNRRWIVVAGAAVVLIALAVPVVAFGIVPLFVRSTLYEPPIGAPTAQTASRPLPEAAATLGPVRSGELRRIDAVHYGTGRVTFTAAALRFEGVSIAGAPNMYVYLSDRTDGQPGNFIDLGPLKATNGSFNYAIPSTLDASSVRSVVVWCRAFSVTVTFAELV